MSGLPPIPENPRPSWQRLSRVDQTGLVWLLHGQPVTNLTAEAATIATSGGRSNTFRRPQAEPPASKTAPVETGKDVTGPAAIADAAAAAGIFLILDNEGLSFRVLRGRGRGDEALERALVEHHDAVAHFLRGRELGFCEPQTATEPPATSAKSEPIKAAPEPAAAVGAASARNARWAAPVSPPPFEMLGASPPGQRCIGCGSGIGGVKRIKLTGQDGAVCLHVYLAALATPRLSQSGILELAGWYIGQLADRRSDPDLAATGALSEAIDGALRQRLGELGVPPEFIEVQFKRVMRVVLA
jgi:hypothetical protein